MMECYSIQNYGIDYTSSKRRLNFLTFSEEVVPTKNNHVRTLTHPLRVVIYDVGFGDKSTIPMQEITHNSFVHLPDDQNDLDQNMDVVNANTQTPAGQYDMVPETQLEVQMVTT